MAYADFMGGDSYPSKHSGASIEVLIIDESDPSRVVIGATTGINWNEDYEAIPVEEAGNEGIDEIVQGRHAISFSVQAFWTPQWGDSLPTRQTFIGQSFTVVERFGPDWPNAGTVINAIVGCRLNRIGSSHSARGPKTVDLAFQGKTRYNGTEWASLSGTM
tara:strand:+ start:526 stop:1008 length:483 start_codon:yes stop_codon:yes gene_type:complete